MAQAVEPVAAYEVLDSFVVDVDGVPVLYRKGEPVHPDDPMVKKHPGNFRPLAFPHPVKQRTRPAVESATAAPGEKRGAK